MTCYIWQHAISHHINYVCTTQLFMCFVKRYTYLFGGSLREGQLFSQIADTANPLVLLGMIVASALPTNLILLYFKVRFLF